MVDEKKVPVGVKIVSVIYYIGAVLGILYGLSFIFLGSLGGTSILGIMPGFITIGIGIFGFFIGKSLWKLRPWSRIVIIIFSSLGVISLVISMTPLHGYFNSFVSTFFFMGITSIMVMIWLQISYRVFESNPLTLFSNLWNILIVILNLWIIEYFLFSKKVKETFA